MHSCFLLACELEESSFIKVSGLRKNVAIRGVVRSSHLDSEAQCAQAPHSLFFVVVVVVSVFGVCGVIHSLCKICICIF